MTSAARLSLPPSFVPSALAEIVVLSDFWSPIGEIRTMLAGLSASGAHGTLIQIVDPAEESFPYSGRVEFVEPEGGGIVTAGRAEKWAQRLRRARGAASRRDSRRDQPARLAVLDPHHQPLGRRTAAVPAQRHDGEQGQRAYRDRQSGATGMIAGLPLSFAEPLLLLGLLSLPVLWWLLRVMPPRPRRVEFPPTRLLFDIAPKEETPSRTPWWLTALRLLAAALLIIAAAGPIWNPPTGVAAGSAPLVILLDDGWSAAASWDVRVKAADELIANADSDRRAVALVPLSEPARDIALMPAGAARVALRQLDAQTLFDRAGRNPARHRALPQGDRQLRHRLAVGRRRYRSRPGISRRPRQDHRGSRVDDFSRAARPSALALVAAENAAAKMTVKVLRADGGVAAGVVRALDLKGSPIGEARYGFAPQDRETEAAFDLPVELRNDIARLEIAGERSAGAVQLLDKRWRRRAIGMVSGSSNDTAQPLLASTFYLTRALAPFADVRLGDRGAPQQAITQFLDQKLPMIVHGRCRHAVAGNSRAHRRLDRARRRAGALRRPASGAGG